MKLPDYTRSLLDTGVLSAGHGRALLAFDDPDLIARKAASENLSVRDLERMSQETPVSQGTARASSGSGKPEKDPDTRQLENTLSDALGLAVTIKHKGEKGELSIKYKSLEQLDELCRKLRL